MTTIQSLKRAVAAIAALLALLFAACTTDTAPGVEIEGNSGVTVGDTLQLSATTIGGSDSSYTWASEDESIATVNSSGLVTAVAVGETTITATGDTTAIVGSHPVVVIPVDDGGGGTTDEPDVDDGGDDTSGGGFDHDHDHDFDHDHDHAADHDHDHADPGVGPELVPYWEAWASSGHADTSAGAFNHWNEDDPAEIPTYCARCHSTAGYKDYLGADGSDPWVVDAAAPVGGTVECTACHNDVTQTLDQVTFPSGVTVTGTGADSRCMTCHQGRSSTDTVDQALLDAGAMDADTVYDDLGFLNIHYYAAGATLMAGKVRGGYQYEGEVYDWRFRHAPGFESCTGCHDPHTLEVKIDACSGCHDAVESTSDIFDIRSLASLGQDYDGDGEVNEGIFYELSGVRDKLLPAIQAYAAATGLDDICYDSHAYPYFFVDTDGDGSCSGGEAIYPNQYSSWTPRLLRAAYNYQVASKDPGAFAHNAKYIIQLLYDSLKDLDEANVDGLVRNDYGHFNGSSEAARHWDEDEEISASCSKCHSGSEGFRFYLEYGVGTGVTEPDNGLDCATCHASFGSDYDLVEVADVEYPSGLVVDSGDNVSNLCSTCHSGRQAKATIDDAIAADKLGFKNVHYLPGGAIRLGADAAVGYEYEGKEYAGAWTGHPGGDDCSACHAPVETFHSFDAHDAFEATCGTTCHSSAAELADIRGSNHGMDYDGDGLADEPLAGEIATLADDLYLSIQAAATGTGGSAICYDPHAYPYFFVDTDGNGTCDGPAEANYGNKFSEWTPELMKAAHNFQITQKEGGAWAHNFDYVIQLLIDSIEDVGGVTDDYVRPE